MTSKNLSQSYTLDSLTDEHWMNLFIDFSKDRGFSENDCRSVESSVLERFRTDLIDQFSQLSGTERIIKAIELWTISGLISRDQLMMAVNASKEYKNPGKAA